MLQQCDQTRPACQRCLKSRRICYGMSTEQTYPVVHSENAYASGEKKRPRGPRPVPVTDSPDEGAGHLLVDLKTQAIVYYFNHHLRTPKETPDLLKVVSDSLLPIWTSKDRCQMLEFAVASMALAVFSRTQKHAQADIEASETYQCLLQLMQGTILSLDSSNIDTHLLCIFFMARYEDVVRRPYQANLTAKFNSTLQSFSHHDGALALLEIWANHLRNGQAPTEIIKLTRRGVIRSALIRNLALPEWIVEGISFGENGLDVEYDRILVRIVNLRHRLAAVNTALLKPTNEPRLTLEELDQEAQDIDEALQAWTTHFPDAWSCREHTLSDLHTMPTNHFYFSAVCSYKMPVYAGVWNLYYTTRMLINSTRLRIIDTNSLNPDGCDHERHSDCTSRLHAMANRLASSIPFLLRRFKVVDSTKSLFPRSSITMNINEEIEPYFALLAVWPLFIAATLKHVDPQQRLWFASELELAGRIAGYGLFESVETNSMPEF
ncbi:hypothetical protein AJ80_07050 [Polytolypa hystricis UAMH7299]|uniref:Zn(2)-C6 fungal-type domain-containing protein n=1 Tax=Polytolypa hystricis (strain UAMH7299) TaxID=1447883 RepID=A0A2B7XRH4_POLH7|nr:hypothetical protein AJ80_07050 [Polytolypa hystricis UAMH7299]